MRLFFRIFLFIVLALGLYLLILTQTNHVARRMLLYNYTDIDDYKIFPYNFIPPHQQPFQFIQGNAIEKPPPLNAVHGTFEFDAYNIENKTAAFLVIRNDSILLERYYNNFGPGMWANSFSTAKSFVSALLGIAFHEGKIKSLDEPIVNFLPELKDKPGFDKVTIYHLLQQCSGIAFRELYYSPFSDAGIFYYGKNLEKAISGLQMESDPGKVWKYHSGNTQLLGFIVKRATGAASLTAYMQDKLWNKIGNQDSISWLTDEETGMEKSYCCINASALDFAKFGKLYLDSGRWNGEQIVPENWVLTTIDMANNPCSGGLYNYQFWTGHNEGDFMTRGLNGEYIYVQPSTKTIVVRLGWRRGHDHNWAGIIGKFCNDINDLN